MSDQIIGDVSVQISGDASELEKSFAEAQSASTQAAGAIADAFNKPDVAKPMEEGIQGLAEQFVALGEALVVTEGLKEFGQEALTAFGTVQSVTIGIEQLTGSVEKADEVVGQIKELAATEPFAFPEIAPTIQKMVALGVSAEQIPGVMHAVADAAAATGNSFQQVANSFDRMTLSGTINARSLVQLGVNTQQLGVAMGVAADQVKAAFLAMDQSQRIEVLEAALGKFAGAAEAQAQGIAGAWQIFQNQFEEVMVSVGEALAPVVSSMLSFTKGLLEDAQAIVQAFIAIPEPIRDFIVVVGLAAAAIVPLTAAVSGIGFAWIGIQSAGTALSGILSAIGVSGGEAAAGETAAALAATDLAVAEEAVAVASAGAGIGLTAVGVSIGGLAAVIAGPVIASILATKSNLDDLKGKWDDLTSTMISRSIVGALNAGETVADLQKVGFAVDQIKTAYLGLGIAGNTISDQLTKAMGSPITALQNLNVNLADVQAALKGIQINGIPVFQLLANSPDFAAFRANVELLGGNLDQIIQKLNGLIPGFTTFSAATKDLAGGFQITIAGAQNFQGALQKVTEEQKKANDALAQSKGALDLAKASLDALTPGTADYATAQQVVTRATIEYDNALLKVTPHGKDFKDSVAGIEQSLRLAQTAFVSASTVFEQLKAGFDKGTVSLIALADGYTKAEAAAKKAGQTFKDVAGAEAVLQGSENNLQATYQTALAVYDNLVARQQAGENVTNLLITATKNLAAAATAVHQPVNTVVGDIAELQAKTLLTQQTLMNAAGAFVTLAHNADGSIASTEAITTKLADLQKLAGPLGITLTQVGAGFVANAADATQATPAIQKAVDALNALGAADLQLIQANGKWITTAQSASDAQKNFADATGKVVDAHTKLIPLIGGGTVAYTKFTEAVTKGTGALQLNAAQTQADVTAMLKLNDSMGQGMTASEKQAAGLISSGQAFDIVTHSSTQTASVMDKVAAGAMTSSQAFDILTGSGTNTANIMDKLSAGAITDAEAFDQLTASANNAANAIGAVGSSIEATNAALASQGTKFGSFGITAPGDQPKVGDIKSEDFINQGPNAVFGGGLYEIQLWTQADIDALTKATAATTSNTASVTAATIATTNLGTAAAGAATPLGAVATAASSAAGPLTAVTAASTQLDSAQQALGTSIGTLTQDMGAVSQSAQGFGQALNTDSQTIAGATQQVASALAVVAGSAATLSQSLTTAASSITQAVSSVITAFDQVAKDASSLASSLVTDTSDINASVQSLVSGLSTSATAALQFGSGLGAGANSIQTAVAALAGQIGGASTALNTLVTNTAQVTPTALSSDLGPLAAAIVLATSDVTQFGNGLVSGTLQFGSALSAVWALAQAFTPLQGIVSVAASDVSAFDQAITQCTSDANTWDVELLGAASAFGALDGVTSQYTKDLQTLDTGVLDFFKDITAVGLEAAQVAIDLGLMDRALLVLPGDLSGLDTAFKGMVTEVDNLSQAIANAIQAVETAATQGIGGGGTSSAPSTGGGAITISGSSGTPVTYIPYSGPSGSNLLPSPPTGGTSPGGTNLYFTFQTGTLVGTNGMNQLTDMVQKKVITALKQAGQKI